jgi:hypothetical protein
METITKEQPKPNFLVKMQQRWQVENLWQVGLILLTFTLTGSTVVYLRKGLFYVLGYNGETAFWLKAITYLLFIFPAYQSLILVYGSLLGQFKFFWEKEKKLFLFIKTKVFRK